MMDSPGADPEETTTGNLEIVDPIVAGRPRRRIPYIVVLAGESLGRVVRLDPNRTMTAGRSRTCDIFFDCDNISREHAIFETDGKGSTQLEDKGSTNGTLVNGKKIATVELCDGDRICMGNVILRYSLKDELEFDFHQDLYDKATRDSLTGSFNKRYFMEAVHREFAYHKRHEKPLSLIIFDIDDFKQLNDTYGHVNGDVVLKSLAREIMSCLRHEDTFARFGGEEFVALFRYTPLSAAIKVSEKLLEMIHSMTFSSKSHSFNVNATIGVSCLEGDNYQSVDEMLMAADEKLYEGKRAGKGCVVG